MTERLSVESFLDTGNRGMFENAGEPVALQPDFGEGQKARQAASCVPFTHTRTSYPDQASPLWRALADRAPNLGWTLPDPHELVDEPHPQILAGMRHLKPVVAKYGHCTFMIPACDQPVRLTSRTTRSCDVRPWVEDHRRLGVMVRRLTLQHSDCADVIPLDSLTPTATYQAAHLPQ